MSDWRPARGTLTGNRKPQPYQWNSSPTNAMVVAIMETTTSVSIFLLKPGREKDFDRDLGDDRTARLPLAAPLEGFFVPFRSDPKPPNWASAVAGLLQPPGTIDLDTQSPGGLLFIRRGGRAFVLTFGHAWMRLRNEWLEPDFGRRVALNLMKEDSLIELRSEQVFAKWHLASERAPRGSSVDSFGVEFDRDMVSVVEGLSTEALLGRTIRGGTNLRGNVDIDDLGAILDRALTEFASNAYQKRWPEIDNLVAVRDPAVIDVLEKGLDAELAAGQGPKKIVLFTPQQRKGDTLVVSSYVIGRLSKTPPLTPYLTFGAWEGYAKKQGKTLTAATAKTMPVHLMDDGAQELGECSVFECFGYEGSLGGKPYVLSSGTWFEVVPTFLKRINDTVKGIPLPSKVLPPWNQTDDEGTYNETCAKKDKSLLHFDKKNVPYGGGRSRFEFCDLMHLGTRRLYFVKVPSKSSGMSHLVEQTRRTVELFFGPDPGFRKALQRTIKKHNPRADTSWTTMRPRPGDWKLCLVSMGRSASLLPFFARCSLANAYRDWRNLGHDVEYLQV
ncbi:MAG: TIGR04141 family sporadically distributed protein [Reyranella sp.]|nr:TIGR04141 family sporadically distributed protein [Reyranella sp.]